MSAGDICLSICTVNELDWMNDIDWWKTKILSNVLAFCKLFHYTYIFFVNVNIALNLNSYEEN